MNLFIYSFIVYQVSNQTNEWNVINDKPLITVYIVYKSLWV